MFTTRLAPRAKGQKETKGKQEPCGRKKGKVCGREGAIASYWVLQSGSSKGTCERKQRGGGKMGKKNHQERGCGP